LGVLGLKNMSTFLHAVQEMEKHVFEADTNKDGSVDQAEALAALTKEYPNASQREKDFAKKVFEHLDKNHDGKVTREEFTRGMTEVLEKHMPEAALIHVKKDDDHHSEPEHHSHVGKADHHPDGSTGEEHPSTVPATEATSLLELEDGFEGDNSLIFDDEEYEF
jgi:hypothetical protein